MKKILIVMVIMLLMVPLYSCGDSEPQEDATTTTTQVDPDADIKGQAEDAVINKLMSDGVSASKIKPQYNKTEKDGDTILVYVQTPMADGTITETVYRATQVDGLWQIDDGEFLGEVTE